MSHNFDLIIKNGTLVDGTGSARRIADIGVLGDKIVYIGNITNHSDSEVLMPPAVLSHRDLLISIHIVIFSV